MVKVNSLVYCQGDGNEVLKVREIRSDGSGAFLHNLRKNYSHGWESMSKLTPIPDEEAKQIEADLLESEKAEQRAKEQRAKEKKLKKKKLSSRACCKA